jgi:hypothetical protein
MFHFLPCFHDVHVRYGSECVACFEYVMLEYHELWLLFYMARPHTQNNALHHNKTPHTIQETMECWKHGVSVQNK